MDPIEAETKSKTGELVGMGCEAHESKFSARQERQSLKRKAFGEAKKLRKVRKVESAAILRQVEVKQPDTDEGEALSNGLHA
jgi:tRNA-dihydrouridine synthase 1